jgi:hypothetical protein
VRAQQLAQHDGRRPRQLAALAEVLAAGRHRDRHGRRGLGGRDDHVQPRLAGAHVRVAPQREHDAVLVLGLFRDLLQDLFIFKGAFV